MIGVGRLAQKGLPGRSITCMIYTWYNIRGKYSYEMEAMMSAKFLMDAEWLLRKPHNLVSMSTCHLSHRHGRSCHVETSEVKAVIGHLILARG